MGVYGRDVKKAPFGLTLMSEPPEMALHGRRYSLTGVRMCVCDQVGLRGRSEVQVRAQTRDDNRYLNTCRRGTRQHAICRLGST